MSSEKGGFVDPKVAGISLAALLAIAGLWLSSTQASNESVIELGPRMTAVEVAIEKHDKWITEWPQTGELSADVRQSTDIAYLKSEVEQLDRNIDILQERIREVEIAAAKRK